MTALTISIGTFSIKVRSEGANEKLEKDIRVEIDWRTLRKFGQTAKTYMLERLHNLLTQYDQHLKQKEQQQMAQWPPHSLFCEKRCCQKSVTSYMRFLKKELHWDAEGHIL